jgi:hypothetical protein
MSQIAQEKESAMSATIQTLPTLDELNDAIMAEIDFFAMLRHRWQDEKEFENFQEYIDAVKKKFPTCFRGLKHPFEFQFNAQGRIVYVRVTMRNLALSSTRCLSNQVAK